MCGLVGTAGNLLYQDEFIMKTMLLFDYLRGEHGTGMAAIRTNGDAIISKLNSNPIDLFNMAQFKAALNGNQSRAFIGHNRQATRGLNVTANAHPFQFDHIVGAHNGTLDYQSHRDLEEAIGEKFSVDSQALFAGIAKLGIEDTIKLCAEGKDNKEGAWALVWFDQKEGSLNFLRNKHRPLWYAYEVGFKRMLWASEWWMMSQAVQQSPNTYKIYTVNESKDRKNVGYFPFDEDVHYKFDLAALCAGSEKRPKPICKVIKGCEKKTVGYSAIVTHPFAHEADHVWPLDKTTRGTHTTTAGTQNSRTKTNSFDSTKNLGNDKDKPRNVLNLIGDIAQPYSRIIDKDKFDKMAAEGCAWCGVDIKYGDAGLAIYERDGRIICRDCNGYPSDVENPPSKIYVRSNIIDMFANQNA